MINLLMVGLIDAARGELRRAVRRQLLLFVATGIVIIAIAFLLGAADIFLTPRLGAAGAAALIGVLLLILALVLVLVARQRRPESAISMPMAALFAAMRGGLEDKAMPLAIAALIAGLILARSTSQPPRGGEES